MRRLVAILFAAAFAFANPLAAQVPQDPPSVAQQQQSAEARFRELTESMQRLHAYLAKVGNQDDLRILRAGMTLTQEKKIQESMGQIRTLLDQQKWDSALERMQVVRTDLAQLLDLLQNRNLDLAKLLERLEQLKGYRGEVDKLAKEQAAEKDESARAQALQEQLAAIEKAKAETDRLIAEQQAVRDQTNALGLQAVAEATKPLADKEKELENAADKLAKDLDQIDKKADELAKPADDGKPSDAQPKDGQPKDGQPKDAKPSDSKPSKSGSSKSGSSAKSASKSMGQAQQQLDQKKAESSLKDQDQAIEALKQAKKDLEAMADEARRELDKLPFDQQAKKQENTQHATDTLAQKMEKAEAEGENEDGQPTPGRKAVQQAVPKQKAAAGTLKEYKPAKQKQQDAKEDLEKARDELDEAINQLRQQLQDAVLRALEERFTAMLAKQREFSLQTKTLDKTRSSALTADGSLPASLVARIQDVATGESDLEVEAADALKLLQEEGTTSVFPEIVDDLKTQLREVARRCRANATDKPVQERQLEVEQTLELLINSLRKTIEMKEGGGQCGQCNGQPQLVPISAELKLIRFLQERVNKRTKDYEEGLPAEMRETDEARAEAQDLAGKQNKVRDLTRKLATKLNQENDAGEDR